MLGLAAGALLLPARWALLPSQGVVAFALGAATLSVVLGSVAPSAVQLGSLVPRFAAVTGGILLLGLLLGLVGAVATLASGGARGHQLVGILVLAAVGIVGGRAIRPVLDGGGMAASTAVALGLAAALALVWVALNALERASPAPTLPPAEPARPASRGFALVQWLGLGLVLAAPWLAAVLGGGILLGVVAALDARRGGAWWRTLSGGFVLPLLPLYWLLHTVKGPGSESLTALRDAPFSTALAVLLVPLLCLSAWGFLGLWPWQRLPRSPLLVPAAGGLLARVGADLLPEGVAHWQPVIFGVLVAGLWHAAFRREPARVSAALGALAIVSLDPGARLGAIVLLSFALVVEAVSPLSARLGHQVAGWARVLWLLPCWALLPAFTGGLRAQVVFTVCAAAGVAAALRPRLAR